MAYTPVYDTDDIKEAIIDVLAGFIVGIAENIVLIATLVALALILEHTTHVFSNLFGMFSRRR